VIFSLVSTESRRRGNPSVQFSTNACGSIDSVFSEDAQRSSRSIEQAPSEPIRCIPRFNKRIPARAITRLARFTILIPWLWPCNYRHAAGAEPATDSEAESLQTLSKSLPGPACGLAARDGRSGGAATTRWYGSGLDFLLHDDEKQMRRNRQRSMQSYSGPSGPADGACAQGYSGSESDVDSSGKLSLNTDAVTS
jgi:hypothetical protein